MRRLVRPFAVALSALLALALAAEWLLLGPSLASAPAAAQAVHATYVPGRGGYARLRAEDGSELQVSCGRVEALCERLRRAAVPRLSVRIARRGALDDPWLLSARIGGSEFVSAAEVERRHLASRAMHGGLALLFGIGAAALWRWLPAEPPR